MGDLYFNIVESKERDSGNFERQSVIVFDEDLRDFLKGFDESLRVFEKMTRERGRSRPARAGERPADGGRDEGRPPAPPRPPLLPKKRPSGADAPD